MKLFILFHHHRHGIDTFPFVAQSTATMDTQILVDQFNIDYEDDREDEYLELEGPFEIEALPVIS